MVEFLYQKGAFEIDSWVDTDYAGCTRTRKSTSGGVIRLGESLVDHTSRDSFVEW